MRRSPAKTRGELKIATAIKAVKIIMRLHFMFSYSSNAGLSQ
jgi:hypothetical protein